jgi:hypothetical protein
MKELDALFLEALEGLSSNGTYQAQSEAPRKDFGPFSGNKGYGFPYQSNNDGSINLGDKTPGPNTPLVSPEFYNVDKDLADGLVYIASAVQKMSNGLKNSVTLSDKQRENLINYIEKLTPCLDTIGSIGQEFVASVNLAGDLPPQSSQAYS